MSRRAPAAVVVLALLIPGCTTTTKDDPSASATIDKGAKRPSADAVISSLAVLPQPELDDKIRVGATYAYVVGTHCGVRFIGLDGDNWVTATPLSSNGTTPTGWDLGGQRGLLEIVSPTQAIFRDSAGHVVTFERQKNTQPAGCA